MAEVGSTAKYIRTCLTQMGSLKEADTLAWEVAQLNR